MTTQMCYILIQVIILYVFVDLQSTRSLQVYKKYQLGKRQIHINQSKYIGNRIFKLGCEFPKCKTNQNNLVKTSLVGSFPTLVLNHLIMVVHFLYAFMSNRQYILELKVLLFTTVSNDSISGWVNFMIKDLQKKLFFLCRL